MKGYINRFIISFAFCLCMSTPAIFGAIRPTQVVAIPRSVRIGVTLLAAYGSAQLLLKLRELYRRPWLAAEQRAAQQSLEATRVACQQAQDSARAAEAQKRQELQTKLKELQRKLAALRTQQQATRQHAVQARDAFAVETNNFAESFATAVVAARMQALLRSAKELDARVVALNASTKAASAEVQSHAIQRAAAQAPRQSITQRVLGYCVGRWFGSGYIAA
jgi:alanyl-tRNA synthetase